MLSDAEIERYSRQILLPEVGGRGQERLRAAGVAICVENESDALHEAALLGALHLAVAGVGRVVPIGSHGATLAGDLGPLVRERNPSVEIAEGVPLDLVIGFGGVPETPLASLASLASGSRIGLLAASAGVACTRCRAALASALAPAEVFRSAFAPFLAALVATGALGRLLGLAGPPVLAFDVARARVLEASAPTHDCPARGRS